MQQSQSSYIPQTHQSLSQLQTQFGIISSSPNSGLGQLSTDIVKPTTVYTYSGTSNGGVVQFNESNSILPQTNIYSSFDPSLNKQVTVTTTTVTQHKRTPSQNSIQQSKSSIPEYNPYQYAVQQVAQQPLEEEKVKKTNNKNGGDSDSSDDEQKEVTELKFSKKVWKKSYILLAQKIIEDLNNKLTLKDAHISQLIKATDLKDQQIQQLSIEINQIRQQNGYSVNVVSQNSQQYLALQAQFEDLLRKCEEFEQDNRQLAQIVQHKEEEKYDLLNNIFLLTAQLEAQSSAGKFQTVVLQSNFSAEAEVWKQKCGQLEAEMQQLRLSQSNQVNYQVEIINMQLKDRNNEIERLKQQLAQIQNNSENQIRLEIENKSLQSQIQTLNAQISSLNIQIQQIQGSSIELQSSMLKINTLELKIKDYETQIQVLQTQIKQSGGNKQRLEEMEQQLIIMNDELQKKQQEINVLIDRCRNLENQLSNLNEVEGLKRSNKEKESKLQQQQLWMENEIKNRDDKIQELMQKCANYEQQISAMESAKGNTGMMEAHIQELNNQIYNLSQQLKIQNMDSNDLRSRCDNLTRQLSEAEAKYQNISAQFQESEYNNKVIIGQNNDLVNKVQQLESQLSQYNVQINQIYLYETQYNQLQGNYFELLTQFVLICSALESQSGNKQPSFDINYLQNNDMEMKILRQDNTDLANKCVILQNQINSKDLETQQILFKFNEIEKSNKIIIDQNSDLQRQLREKDSEILVLKTNQTSSIQLITLQQEVSEWKAKYEQSKNDILIVAENVERLKGFLNEKDQEMIQWRNKANQQTFLEGENSRLRIQVQNLEEEINMLKRTDRISAPDNNHQLILQLSQRDSELEEHKKRLAAYALKNAELQGEVEFLKTKKLSGAPDDLSIGSQADKDQLIHKYRIENKRLNDDLQQLQQLIKIQQTEIRYQKGVKGCGYGCN
ncbi:hypothetical protein TTHERM_00637030 (macronuclear) [Tetrahymena thermophila SB210]|uniref:Uncharacterized protein n=1 Tax=Tetrahymena thermophila (strain SB210) TaxID=312017 RepID=Q22HK0_TETTS|nr:hypothetical protein TTHERM_00637030 [Tetrahymena thermophila SB210]EAR84701.2 hypothetical protein TTHERM_00637030 [Tetrahymena thermophila SB210]|eukprot:XP_001032364.2 hypothetical protein TTHERM_00637030 [Tetrahymena thermophila SB210]